jgi:large subunit ribosomal protein L17
MRHQVRGKKLGRTSSHRLATMRALSSALIKNQRIVTTLAKAKELRRYVEPLITRARKEDNSHNRRQVFSFLNDKEAVKALYDVVIPEISDRPGGFTRVIKLGSRAGDGAPMAVIELVDFNDVKPEGKTSKKKRTRRAGRKKATTAEEMSSAAETVEETVSEPVDTEATEANEEASAEAEVEIKAESEAEAEAPAADQPDSQEDPDKGK